MIAVCNCKHSERIHDQDSYQPHCSSENNSIKGNMPFGSQSLTGNIAQFANLWNLKNNEAKTYACVTTSSPRKKMRKRKSFGIEHGSDIYSNFTSSRVFW